MLNMTPLIDCIFQLLIFFLVATRFAEEDRSLEVQLPTASEAVPMTVKPKEMFINIDDAARIFVDGRVVAEDELETLMRQARANNPLNQSVVIRADRRVHFQPVVTVMNLCNKVGINQYTVTTAGDD